MGEFCAIFIVGFIVLGIYKVFELFVRRRERLAIIEKMAVSLENKSVSAIDFPSITFARKDYGSGSLRTALLLAGIGAGCLLSFFIQIFVLEGVANNPHYSQFYYGDSVLLVNFACISFLGGMGLLAAYFIESKQKSRN